MRSDFLEVSPPRYCSPIPEGTDLSNAERGAELQRLPLTPQGRIVAGVLESKRPSGLPSHRSVVVEIPRRATKTTSIQNVLLGRCVNIPGYFVISTAQDGTRASEFMADLMDLLETHAEEITDEHNAEIEAAWTDPDKDPPLEDPKKWGLLQLGIKQLYRSQGREQIKFSNGSKWKSVPPEPSKLRGKGVRALWMDEGGELDPDEGPKLLGGALPVLDTSPDAQFIISGTPGEERRGSFWEYLTKGREDEENRGIVDYCADDLADPEDEGEWMRNHPGLACGLTSIEIIRERFHDMDLAEFKREYMCIWPVDAKSTALDLRKWEVTGRDPRIEPPALTWAMGFDVDPAGKSGAVATAWIDEHNAPHVQIMRHRSGGVSWMNEYITRGLLKFPRVKLGYDSIGQNVAMADDLRAKPRIRSKQVQALTMKDAGSGTALISRGVDNMSIWHGTHPILDKQISTATWRESGSTMLFRASAGEITCLRAALAALALVNKERRPATPQPADAVRTSRVRTF
ncbi:hypothetical protein [Glutamicibacter sp. NPDC087673]|uniref:hypothetical protein n=1 Tax=Glutamicibacter sp. NPDC087673 TaxID=3363997 RepID=UPI0037F9969D